MRASKKSVNFCTKARGDPKIDTKEEWQQKYHTHFSFILKNVKFTVHFYNTYILENIQKLETSGMNLNYWVSDH